MSSENSIQKILTEIFLAKRRSIGVNENTGLQKVSTSDMVITAGELSRLADKNPPWSGRALQSVYSGTNKPGKLLISAIEKMYASMNGLPPISVDLELILVRVPKGAVKPGSIFLGGSRPCQRPGCTVNFVPKVPNQVFCSEYCRKK